MGQVQVWLQTFDLFCREVVGPKVVSVAVTPNGYADAVFQDRFVMPEERQMPFTDFLDIVEKKVTSPNVFYVQKQCSNLTEEFPELVCDVQPDIPWMSEALGNLISPVFCTYFVWSFKTIMCMVNACSSGCHSSVWFHLLRE